MSMARIVLNTFGSLGDLHPFLAIAIELRKRGHEAIVASAEVYREKVLAAGVGFLPVRPDIGALAGDRELLRRLWDPRRGSEFLYREILIPHIEESVADMLAAAAGADLLVTHTAGLGGPIAAEKLKLRWVSAVLQPIAFFSSYDPPIFAPAPALKYFHALGPWAFRLTRSASRSAVGRWMKPVRELRRRLVLPEGGNPAFEGQFSPYGTLALFSRHFAKPQPDWPARTRQTGFVYYDDFGPGMPGYASAEVKSDAKRLEEFLAAGPAPVVFTLGSSAVMQAGDFFYESALAAKQLNVRAVLLTGRQDHLRLPEPLPDLIFVAGYAPYSQLLPRAAVTVHQGGIGTIAQALRAGKPMLVVPWSHDQPDNAERLRRLGLARTLSRGRYKSDRAAVELDTLLSDPAYAKAASAMKANLLAENGAQSAADALEAILAENRVAPVLS